MLLTSNLPRRSFLSRFLGVAGLASLGERAHGLSHASLRQDAQKEAYLLPRIALLQNYQSLKQSSYDRSGGNNDWWPIGAGTTKEIFSSDGPGMITHIWFTMAADEKTLPLKRVVLRIYWDGNSKPSVETPLGDFFGLNLAEYVPYQSAFMNCASVKALNCYFPMPFRRSARITITNEGDSPIMAFYSNIDYQLVRSLPEEALYFHAQYRQETPTQAVTGGNQLNPDGKNNYVFFETRGQGHLMGVTLGVQQNSEGWMGEGDDMTFIDDETKPVINGTGMEDYINGAWGFGITVPFAYLYSGAPLIANPVHAGGRYCMYRWHADNPIAFTRYLKQSIEHGTANGRSDDYYSVGYWYQREPYTDFPPFPSLSERTARLKLRS